mmetsp:Transcript_47391/g.90491  ORF Transcript_47391/g.90491 Transcript_47391/m.90491 type:complete len:415 (+) Transcript_47391:1365-2609(+)
MKEAIGRLGFLSPTRARRTAREMATTASSCPMMRVCSFSSISSRRFDSSEDTFSTGMPVQAATMAAMSLSVTTGPMPPSSSAASVSRLAEVMAEICAFSSISRSRSDPAFSKSCPRTAPSFSLSRALSSLSSSRASSGRAAWRSRTRDPASSIRSIALSGRKRSEMYWYDSCAAASNASSVYVSLWCVSYRSRSPPRILMQSGTDGSGTCTGWNRRSSAGSFSMCLRYSSRVVAPMHWSSPRANAGFKMFAASMAPSAAPAPMRVCTSSIMRMMSSACLISSMSFFKRSSNSPRYLVPATSRPMSRVITRLPSMVSGTSPAVIICARPSAIAVLPTPGSPMRMGLFFVRRPRIWVTRSISLERPTTGSRRPSSACFVRSVPYSSRVGVLLVPPAAPPPTPAPTVSADSPTMRIT